MHRVILRRRRSGGGEELVCYCRLRKGGRYAVVRAKAFIDTHVDGSGGGVLRASFPCCGHRYRAPCPEVWVSG
jgi:hypothetical protein